MNTVLAFSCIISAFLWNTSNASPSSEIRPLIVGGVKATPYEFPWIVELRADPDRDPKTPNSIHYCGGAIVNEKWIVTAAHCIDFPASFYEIVAGEHNLTIAEGFEQKSGVAKIIVHPRFNERYLEFDIALMRLKNPFVFNDKVQPALLAEPTFTAKGVSVVAGWGSLSFGGKSPDVLMKVDVPVIPLETCRQLYPNETNPVFDYNICAGYLEGVKDSCNGDSGGPLMCRTTVDGRKQTKLCGLVSWGGLGAGSCAAPNEPGVYTAVAKLNKWIQSIVKTGRSDRRDIWWWRAWRRH